MLSSEDSGCNGDEEPDLQLEDWEAGTIERQDGAEASPPPMGAVEDSLLFESKGSWSHPSSSANLGQIPQSSLRPTRNQPRQTQWSPQFVIRDFDVHCVYKCTCAVEHILLRCIDLLP